VAHRLDSGRETADFRHMRRAGINGLFALAA
jgi:hypothetical protein